MVYFKVENIRNYLERNKVITVKYEKIHPDAITPQQATTGSAGFDLFSVEDVTIHAGETRIVHTGIRVELLPGHLMYISSKGGPAGKDNVFVLNSPGLLDQDYRGEIIVILHKTLYNKNWIQKLWELVLLFCSGGTERPKDNTAYFIKRGQKIAQFVILPYPQVQLIESFVDVNTERGEGKLGSTGLYHNG